MLSPEAQAKAQDRIRSWTEALRPRNPLEADLARLVAETYTRLEQCHAELFSTRAYLAERAEGAWDEDREAELSNILKHLTAEPDLTVKLLARTAHGAHWMLLQWEGLRDHLAAGEPWTPDQRKLALDLLGVTPCLRGISTIIDCRPPQPGTPADPAEVRRHRLALCNERIRHLSNSLDDVLLMLDDDDREYARHGIFVESRPILVRLERYECGLHRRLAQLLAWFDRRDPLTVPRSSRATSTPAPVAAPPSPPTPKVAASAPEPPVLRSAITDTDELLFSTVFAPRGQGDKTKPTSRVAFAVGSPKAAPETGSRPRSTPPQTLDLGAVLNE
ncbi:MAG: hypothetical protein SFX72_09130 [Isosphaeraceae bacterium]|nr:hypothetical protein [Isosphaeraceae bacterium]